MRAPRGSGPDLDQSSLPSRSSSNAHEREGRDALVYGPILRWPLSDRRAGPGRRGLRLFRHRQVGRRGSGWPDLAERRAEPALAGGVTCRSTKTSRLDLREPGNGEPPRRARRFACSPRQARMDQGERTPRLQLNVCSENAPSPVRVTARHAPASRRRRLGATRPGNAGKHAARMTFTG